MKRKLALGSIAAAAMLGAPLAQAQSSVNIYGVLDVGAYRNTNRLGGSVLRMETRHEPSYIGFRGSEDLGGGLEATFQLEGSIPVDTGAFSSFNRYSIVGLRSKDWGAVTFGRQYDTMIDIVGVDAPRFNSVNAVHTGNWDRSSGTFVNNSIKYRSPTFGGGFNFSLLYVLKEDGTSAVNTGTAYGATANYISGPLRVTGAYLQINGVTHRPFNDFGVRDVFGQAFTTTAASIVTDDTIWGIGAYYDFGKLRVLGNYTDTKAETANGRSATTKTVSAGAVYNPTETGFRPSFGVNRTSLGDARWTTAYAILDYYLSRRTDIYARVVSQKASGPAQAALYLEGPSSTRSQTVFGVGVTHRF